MSDSSSGLSSKKINFYFDTITVQDIQDLAVQAVEDFKCPDTVFISNDLYADMAKDFLSNLRYNGPISPNVQIASINTTAGELRFRKVPGMSNFCFVGTEEDFNLVERFKIDKEFQEIFFGEDTIYRGPALEDNQLSAGTAVPEVAQCSDRGSKARSSGESR